MIIPTFLNLLFVLWFLNCFLVKRVRRRIFVFLLMFIISLVLSSVNCNGLTILGKMLTIFLFYLCSVFCFQENKWKIAYIFLISYCIIILSEFVTLLITNLFTGFYSLNSTITLLIMTLCTQFCNYGIGILLKKFLYFNETDNSIKNSVAFYIVPFVLTTFFIISISDYNVLFSKNVIYLIIFLFMMIIDLLSIAMIKHVLDILETKKELELSQVKKNTLESQIELISLNYNINFSFMHDSLHTLSKLKGLVEQNKIEDFYAQIDRYADETQKNLYSIYSNSPAISTFLLQNKEILSRYQISINSTLKSKNMEISLSYEFARFINFILTYATKICINTYMNDKKIIIIKSNDIGTKNSVFKLMFTGSYDVLCDSQTLTIIDYIKENYSGQANVIYKDVEKMIVLTVYFLNK